MTLRQRFARDPFKLVKQLDAFPKVPEECQQSSKIGGTRKQFLPNHLKYLLSSHCCYTFCLQFYNVTVSVISIALILYVIYIESVYYLDHTLVFKFKPDTDMDRKIRLNIDLTVATPCSCEFLPLLLGFSRSHSTILNVNRLIFMSSHRFRHIRLDGPECIFIWCAGGAGHMVGTVSRTTKLLRVHTTLKRLFTRRISLTQRKSNIVELFIVCLFSNYDHVISYTSVLFHILYHVLRRV